MDEDGENEEKGKGRKGKEDCQSAVGSEQLKYRRDLAESQTVKLEASALTFLL